jgi:hypothetical protein
MAILCRTNENWCLNNGYPLSDAKNVVNQDWIAFIQASLKDKRPSFGGLPCLTINKHLPGLQKL